MLPKPTDFLLSLQFQPLYLVLSLADPRHAALEGMLPQPILPAHKARMSFPLLGCFSQVFIAILLHVPPRLKRFFSSCTVCLEG